MVARGVQVAVQQLVYLLPGGGVPAQDHGGGGSPRQGPQIWAGSPGARLLELQGGLGQVPASPHGELHVPPLGVLLPAAQLPTLDPRPTGPGALGGRGGGGQTGLHWVTPKMKTFHLQFFPIAMTVFPIPLTSFLNS